MTINLAIVFVSPGHGGNLLAVGVVLMAFVIAMPLLIGALVQALAEEGVKYLRHRSRSRDERTHRAV